MGYRREAAARYSFLLAIPAVLRLRTLRAQDRRPASPVDWGPTLLATGIAFVVGLAVIVYFLRYISTHTFRPFVVYRIALGLVVLGLLAAGVIDT